MQKRASVILEVSSTADQFTAAYQLQSITAPEPEPSPSPTDPTGPNVHTSGDIHASSGHEYPDPAKSFSPEDFHLTRENTQDFWAQLSFGDDANDPLQDWSWDDIESILRNSSTQPGIPENRRRLL